MVRPSGLEPPTPTMSRWCSNQLSYGRRMVRSIGLEPTTPTMSRWCSNQLSYVPAMEAHFREIRRGVNTFFR